MSDLLVKLYDLPTADAAAAGAVEIRKPIGPETRLVVEWILGEFGDAWAAEAQVALGNRPQTLHLAIEAGRPVGFACFDATLRGFFGPIGVAASVRGRGVGAALLRASLAEMRAVGYGYAIVGAAGAPEFFRRCAGATEIPDSAPGVYGGMLRSIR